MTTYFLICLIVGLLIFVAKRMGKDGLRNKTYIFKHKKVEKELGYRNQLFENIINGDDRYKDFQTDEETHPTCSNRGKNNYQKRDPAPTRTHAKPEIDKFLDVKKKTQLIVFDFETNGLDGNCSVLSCSAIKYIIDPKNCEMMEVDRFNRYYYPIERFNPQATAVNGLIREVIQEKRADSAYPDHFIEDSGFMNFCNNVHRFVAHNISFDKQFFSLINNKKKFCTMMTNMDIVAAGFLTWKNQWKWPKLSEAAAYYGIPFNDSDLHNSMFDTELTAKIFMKMLERAQKHSNATD